LGGLQAFADLLQSNTEQELKPGAARAENEIQNGVQVGRAFPGGDIAAARQMLAYALVRARDNATRHVQAAEILAVAIRRALENYTGSDRDTAGRVALVENILLEAVAAAQIAMQSQAPVSSTGFQP
jgi:hypothetical protein